MQTRIELLCRIILLIVLMAFITRAFSTRRLGAQGRLGVNRAYATAHVEEFFFVAAEAARGRPSEQGARICGGTRFTLVLILLAIGRAEELDWSTDCCAGWCDYEYHTGVVQAIHSIIDVDLVGQVRSLSQRRCKEMDFEKGCQGIGNCTITSFSL